MNPQERMTATECRSRNIVRKARQLGFSTMLMNDMNCVIKRWYLSLPIWKRILLLRCDFVKARWRLFLPMLLSKRRPMKDIEHEYPSTPEEALVTPK